MFCEKQHFLAIPIFEESKGEFTVKTQDFGRGNGI